jgi:CxxC motif-containing protein (DUF1111 family)
MRPRRLYLLLAVTTVIGTTVVLASEHYLKEAPAGFETPIVAQNPGSGSVSNGIDEPAGDNFALDQQIFELKHDAASGLGPLFNGTSCSECHQHNVIGSANQITEVRVGHLDSNGNFTNPTVLINGGATAITGRSIINDRSLCPEAQEHVPASETIHSLRAVLSTLGDGFVEAVDDQTLLAIAARQPNQSSGMIHGEAVEMPVLESPGEMRIGRFGWKDQQPTVLSFAADAYLNEMGVTNRLRPKDTTSVCKVTSDPEDVPDAIGLANIDHFAQFIRGTKAPPRDLALAKTTEARIGQHIFDEIGCRVCHVGTLFTAPAGTAINGGAFVIPEALGSKIIHPFGDYLLHDVGTGDGIVQGGPPETAAKLRTSPLWGLRTRSRFMHDLASLTLEDAILRHGGEAADVTNRFRALETGPKQQLLTFLNSL